jgi:hypothetical protein
MQRRRNNRIGHATCDDGAPQDPFGLCGKTPLGTGTARQDDAAATGECERLGVDAIGE